MELHDTFCYLNDRIVKYSEAKVSIGDIGLLRSYGISDVMKAYGRKIFLLDRHIERFFRSTKLLNILLPFTKDRLASILNELLERNDFSIYTIRMIATGGAMIDSITFNPSRPTFYIIVEPFVEMPAEAYARGVTIISREFERFMPEVKTTMYVPAVLWHSDKVKVGAAEVLYVSDGKIRECSTSNFFVVRDGQIITPKEKILPGITRGLTIELAESVGGVEERDVSVSELTDVDEAFLTATNKKIVPVVWVDGKRIAGGKVGPMTNKMMKLFDEYVAAHYA